MFCIVDRKVEVSTYLYGIVDTNDGVVEYYDESELLKILQSGVKIEGLHNERDLLTLSSIDINKDFIFKTMPITECCTNVGTYIYSKHSKSEKLYYYSSYYNKPINFNICIRNSDMKPDNLVKTGKYLAFIELNIDKIKNVGSLGSYNTIRDAKRAVMIWSQSIGGDFKKLVKRAK